MISGLTISGMRNLSDAEFRFGRTTNVVLGPNGAGKTSLLESVVILGNIRSFRASSVRQVVAHGRPGFRVAGLISTGGRQYCLEQVVEHGPSLERTLLVDGKTVSVERYLQLCPVFAIARSDRELVVGGPENRRRFLDRFVFLLRPTHLEEIRSYRRALRQRNAALVSGVTDAEVEAWEIPLAMSAARVIEARIDAQITLSELFRQVWRELSAEASPAITLAYRAEPWNGPFEGRETVEVLYRQRYNENRTRDRQMGFTVDGPHRHDLSIKADGRSVRYELSSGQIKVVAAALKLAALTQVERDRNESLPVIVDDVDAELDTAALKRLAHSLGSKRQLFLSSTSEHVMDLVGSRGCSIWLENGSSVTQGASTDD
ncbi:MAG: DNA replication and repair protein RecF [Acidobacteriota bacterium]